MVCFLSLLNRRLFFCNHFENVIAVRIKFAVAMALQDIHN